MFDHVGISVRDREASRRFYDTVLAALGRPPRLSTDEFDEWGDWGIAQESADRPRTRRLHVGFAAASRADVDAFWQAGAGAGYTSDGEPGPRPAYTSDYYGGFLLDPDGNSAEAAYLQRRDRHEPVVDHLWLRVADLAASRRFYETIAPVFGFEVGGSRPEERFHVRGDDRSFSLVQGDLPTANVHIAFVGDEDMVERFHEVAVAAGYRDNGAPGVRSYAAGYYGSFVLDPDGNNIEAVHHRGGD